MIDIPSLLRDETIKQLLKKNKSLLFKQKFYFSHYPDKLIFIFFVQII